MSWVVAHETETKEKSSCVTPKVIAVGYGSGHLWERLQGELWL